MNIYKTEFLTWQRDEFLISNFPSRRQRLCRCLWSPLPHQGIRTFSPVLSRRVSGVGDKPGDSSEKAVSARLADSLQHLRLPLHLPRALLGLHVR